MASSKNLSRRDFLQAGALLSGGLVIAFTIPGARRLMAATAAGDDGTFAPNAFLRITSDDKLTILLAHSEMGQGIWTTLPMLVAEELDADWKTITVEHAPAAPAYAHTAFGMQMTGGSTTTWSEFDRYRQAGAVARTLLVKAAAKRFGVAESACRTEGGAVIAGDKSARYGELAADAAKIPVPKSVPLRPAKDWKLIGKPTKRLDTAEKITGRAQFGLDVQFPGLLTAVVLRSPVFGGTVKSFDASKASAIPGVRKVVQVPSGVAVVADNFWAAKLGRDALSVEWDRGPNAALDTAAMTQSLRDLCATPGMKAAAQGDVAAGMAKAVKTLEADYAVPYLAHAPMEPLNCTVRVNADGAEVWTGTQFQTVDQATAAEVLGLKPEQVKVHTMFLGGGYGRRANPMADFVREAAHVAKAAGVPVKTVWTREDDTRGGYYRPQFLHRLQVGVGADGMPVAWKHVIAGQSLIAGTPFEGMMIKDGIDGTSVEGVADSPYLPGIPDHRVELHSPKTGIPVLWWRSVGHSHSAFAMECMIDELAHAAGKDPVEYRRALLGKHPRHLGVLNMLAEKSGWGTPLPKDRARGIALHESFGSFVGHVAEVSVTGGVIRVHQVVSVIDCGIAVNPSGIEAQLQGAVSFALSAVLHSRLTFKGGEVEQSNFHDFPVLRLNEMPIVRAYVVPSTEKLGGAGEPGVPAVAPAVANAVFALTGKRLRELPLSMGA